MANPIGEKAKSLLLWIEQHGPLWVEQNHPHLMRDAVYYGYLKNEEIDLAKESYQQKLPLSKNNSPQLTLPLPEASLALPQQPALVKPIARITDFKTLETKIVDRDSYAQAVKAIDGICARDNKNAQPAYKKEKGEILYAPLTLRESMKAMVEDFNKPFTAKGKTRTYGDRLALFSCEIATLSAIVYLKNSLKCKIIPFCKELLLLQDDNDLLHQQIDYNNFNGFEIDLANRKYNAGLTPKELLEHNGWLAAVEYDAGLLLEFNAILLNHWPIRKKSIREAMGFFCLNYRPYDQLSAIILKDAGNLCALESRSNLNVKTQFIRLVKE